MCGSAEAFVQQRLQLLLPAARQSAARRELMDSTAKTATVTMTAVTDESNAKKTVSKNAVVGLDPLHSLHPKAPCTHIAYIWALRYLYRDPFSLRPKYLL